MFTVSLNCSKTPFPPSEDLDELDSLVLDWFYALMLEHLDGGQCKGTIHEVRVHEYHSTS